jgi:protein TonB
MQMRMLALAVAMFSVSVMAQTGPVPMIKEDGPPPGVLRGANAETIAVSQDVLRGMAELEPDIAARDAAAQPGVVLVNVLVSKTGAVEEATAVTGQGELPKIAVAGVMGWKYRPYMVDGQPQEIQSSVTVLFRDGVGKRMVFNRTGVAGMAGMTGVAGMSGLGPATPNGAVRVSSGVIAGLMEHSVAPVYPPIAKAAHVQGVVIMHALISKTGDIENLQVISGPPMLAASAMDAVRQWKYRPYFLQGEPVAVETTINVNFTFSDPKKPDGAGAPAGETAPVATPDPK